MFNLLEEKWIPVETLSGKKILISPYEMTLNYPNDPIKKIAGPRQDINCSLLEFLIGLFQTANILQSELDWFDQLQSPPSTDQLYSLLAPFKPYFNLFGEGACFLQDFDPKLEGNIWPVEKLVFGSPGKNAIKNNADFFVKRKAIKCMCPACIAAVLYNLQTHVGGGGSGFMGALRGAGPLTSIVLGRNLWETVWSNILPLEDYPFLSLEEPSQSAALVFPWLKPVSDNKTTEENTHALHAFWGMPRRVRLKKIDREEYCDLCGCKSASIIEECLSKNYGYQYDGVWRHTLSPIVEDETNGVKCQKIHSGLICYQHWLQISIANQNNGKRYRPALAISHFRQNRAARLYRKLSISFQLQAFGYELDQDKTRAFYHRDFLLLDLPDHVAAKCHEYLERAVQIAKHWEEKLSLAILSAWKSEEARKKCASPSSCKDPFWRNTEPDFFSFLHHLREWLEKFPESVDIPQPLHDWNENLCKHSLTIFDHFTTSGLIEHESLQRIAKARQSLKLMKSSKTTLALIGSKKNV
jgi:CRISPR system Cascade subunit CasA